MTFRDVLRGSWASAAMLVLMGIQWPFRWVADALEDPIERRRDIIEKILEEPK